MEFSRIETVNQIANCKSFNSKGDYEKSFDLSNQCISSLIHFNFLPLLADVIKEHQIAALNLGKLQDVCQDFFLLLSPKLKVPNRKDLFNQLLVFIEGMLNLEISFEDFYLFLFPIDIDINYEVDKIIAGQDPNVLITIQSHLPDTISINEFSLLLTNDLDIDNTEVLTIHENLQLVPNITTNYTIKRHLPQSISKETIKNFIFTYQHISITIPLFNKTIFITPDESACRINFKLPDTCIIGVDLPFSVSLTASEQSIKDLTILFETENPSIPLFINGTFNGISIKLNEKIDLPDIPENQTLELNLTIKTTVPIMNPVNFTYSFGTKLSGKGEFKKSILFDFVSPFLPRMNLYDDNFLLIQNLALVSIDDGKPITFELSLANNISSPIKIVNIDFPESIETVPEENIVIQSYEQYSIIGQIKEPCKTDINVNYEVNGIPRSVFTVKMPNFVKTSSNISVNIIHPPTVIVFSEFEVKICIARRVTNSFDPEVCPVSVTVLPSDNFFIHGPIFNNKLFLFKGQTKEITFKVMPLQTGSIALPQFIVTDLSGTDDHPKRFVSTIIVNYK